MKISVITVCYNSDATLEHTIESVRSQTYPLYEHIIIDGGSTDDTPDILKRSKSDPKIKFISESDSGIYDAMNKGISMAGGDVVAILNSDDFYSTPYVFSEVVNLFNIDPSVDVLLGGVKFVENSNISKFTRSISSVGFSPWMLRFGFMPPHPSAFIKKSCYDTLGIYNIKLKIAADFDFFVRSLLSSKLKFTCHSNFWVYMRNGGVSNSGLRSSHVITKEMLISLRGYGFKSFYFLLLFRFPIKFITQKILWRFV